MKENSTFHSSAHLRFRFQQINVRIQRAEAVFFVEHLELNEFDEHCAIFYDILIQ